MAKKIYVSSLRGPAGPPGAAGSNVLPTDEGIAQAIGDTESDTREALDLVIGDSVDNYLDTNDIADETYVQDYVTNNAATASDLSLRTQRFGWYYRSSNLNIASKGNYKRIIGWKNHSRTGLQMDEFFKSHSDGDFIVKYPGLYEILLVVHWASSKKKRRGNGSRRTAIYAPTVQERTYTLPSGTGQAFMRQSLKAYMEEDQRIRFGVYQNSGQVQAIKGTNETGWHTYCQIHWLGE